MFQPNRTQISFSQRKVFSLAPQNKKSQHLINHCYLSLGEGQVSIFGLCSLILKFSCNLAGIYATQSLNCRVKFQQQCLYKLIGEEGEGIGSPLPQPPGSKQEGDRQCCCRVYFSNWLFGSSWYLYLYSPISPITHFHISFAPSEDLNWLEFFTWLPEFSVVPPFFRLLWFFMNLY